MYFKLSLLAVLMILCKFNYAYSQEISDPTAIFENIALTYQTRGDSKKSASKLPPVNIKVKVSSISVQTDELTGLEYVEVKGMIKKYRENPKTCLAKRCYLEVCYHTLDTSWLKRSKNSWARIPGTINDIEFHSDKLKETPPVNSSKVTIFSNDYASKSSAILTQKKQRAQKKQQLSKDLEGKVCAIVVNSAYNARFGGMTIEGYIWFPEEISAKYMELNFGIYYKDSQVSSAMTNIANFSGDSWSFTCRGLKEGDTYSFSNMKINFSEVPHSKILYITPSKFSKYGLKR